jgi:pyruvate dehydrogenase E1 component
MIRRLPASWPSLWITAPARRSFFEVDRYHSVLSALQSLADSGCVPRAALTQALQRYAIDTEALASWLR